MKGPLEQVDFGIIRYANCWEDAGVLLDALKDGSPQRIAIIASAGDNALALLSEAPESVLAFDISLPQLYLTELKQMAYARLEYDELLCLLGVRTATAAQRLQLLEQISSTLSKDARTYWTERKTMVEKGVIHAGKFERYFHLFRNYCMPIVHSRKTIDALLLPKSDDEQQEFFHNRWSNLRWRLLMNVFFSKAVMGRAGRDPQFLKQVDISVSEYIRDKAAAHLQSSAATHNHFLHYMLTGNFSDVLPHYLRRENHNAIRANIGRMTIRQATADEVIGMQAHDTYCLSNIFEYFPDEQFHATVKSWNELLPSGALLLYWNLMVPRSFADIAPDSFIRTALTDVVDDAGFFYTAFLKEQKK